MTLNGMWTYTIDPRGRVSIPPLSRGLTVWSGFWLVNCLILVPAPVEQLADAAARRVAFPATPRHHGRFSIPAPVRHALGFRPGDDLYVTGMGGWLEYWRPEVFAALHGLTARGGRAVAAGMPHALMERETR